MKVLVANTTTSPYLDVRILMRITLGDTANPNHAAASSSSQGPVPMDLDAANMQPRNANANANRGNQTRDMSQVKCFACG